MTPNGTGFRPRRPNRGLLGVLLVLTGITAAPAGEPQPFDPKPWLEDLVQVREVLATKYANLEWAVFQREADLPALFDETKARIEKAASEADARAAFERLTRRLGDEHVVFDWPSANPTGGKTAPSDVCRSLGYNPAMRAVPLAANASGYRPLSNAQAEEFPSGIVAVAGRHVGILQIGVFSPKGFPSLCLRAMQALAIPADKPCDDACDDRIESWAAGQLTHDLIEEIRALHEAGADVLLVDIAGNGGGSEWAEAAARLFTPIRLRSEEMGFVRGEHWAKSFAADEATLREFARQETGRDRALLLRLADQIEEKRQQALAPCDSAPLWRGAHLECSWLGKGFYSSGLLASADPAQLRGKPWAPNVFTPMEFPYEEGVWRGPLIVLVDRGVSSAASEFTAVLQDNHAAIVMGEPAGGGCGHTNEGTPTTLANSKAVLEMPDCARFRADGSNEVTGVQPDVLVPFSARDGAHLRGARFAARLPEAVERAVTLRR